MTRNVYRTAQGKMVDMGALTLQNEMTRAVGNMNVNARGDRVDGSNQVIDPRNQQVQRQHHRRSNISNAPVHTSSVTAKQAAIEPDPVVENLVGATEELEDILGPLDIDTLTIVQEAEVIPVVAEPVDLAVDQAAIPASGLAAALAKAKTVKQTLDPTAKQKAQAQGVRKL